MSADTRSQAVSKARKRKRRGGDRVVKARLMTEKELATARKGSWVRTGPNGEPPGYRPSKHGFGPKPKQRVTYS